MSSKSTSSQTPQCLLIPFSKVKFQHHENIIAYDNAVALLEHHEPLFKPMLSFLSNDSICTALTKEPSAMYIEYIKHFCPTDSKTDVPLPPKGTIRVGLASLGLADKDKPSLTSTELGSHDQINLSQQTIAYCLIFGLEINIGDIIFKDLINKLHNGKKNMEANISTSFQTPSASKFSLTFHMLKVAKLSKEPEQSLLPPSREVNADDTADKSLSRTSVQLVTQPKEPTTKKPRKKKIPSSTQPKVSNDSREMNPLSTTTHLLATKEFVVPEKVIELKEITEEQSLEIPMVEQLLDEVDNHNKPIHEPSESPYETESEIMVVKSILGFKTVDSDNFLNNEVSTSDQIVQDDNASAERLSFPDYMDYICKEVSYFHSKLGDMESSITEIKFVTLQKERSKVIRSEVAKKVQVVGLEGIREHQIAKNITPPEPTLETQWDLAFKESTMVLYDTKKNLVHLTAEQESEDDDDVDKQPLSKRFKIMHLVPIKSHLSVEQFTDQLFGTTTSKFSPSSPKEPTPPREESKWKCITIEKPPRNELVSFQEKGGFNHKMPNIKSFITLEGLLSQDKIDEQLRELKRLGDLKAQEEKLEEELRKMFNQATLKAQAQKWTEHEAKKAKMIKDFNHQISFISVNH
ncbi:hypothetical protein Tco_0071582 [Tanacetum coccineum]